MNAARPTPATVAQTLDLLVRNPGTPRLTWYGDAGERVELSGAVLENWVNKTVNLLVEEFDAGPGTRIVLDLPAHWRTAVWALGAWRCGATVVLTSDAAPGAAAAGPRADVVVSVRPAAWSGSGADLVAVALPALARRFDGELPAGATDAASAVMTYADVVGWAPEPEPDAVALEAAGGADVVAHRDLVREDDDGGARVLVDGRADLATVLLRLLAVWASDGSVVLTSPTTAAELEADPTRRERLVTQEGVSA